MWAIGEPSGPIENGMTYIVRPRIAPVYSSLSWRRISAGSRQLFVGPASASRSEQMNVRSSTLRDVGRIGVCPEAVRPLLRVEGGERAGGDEVGAELSAYSSSDPSHQWTASGCRIAAQSSTHWSSFSLLV